MVSTRRFVLCIVSLVLFGSVFLSCKPGSGAVSETDTDSVSDAISNSVSETVTEPASDAAGSEESIATAVEADSPSASYTFSSIKEKWSLEGITLSVETLTLEEEDSSNREIKPFFSLWHGEQKVYDNTSLSHSYNNSTRTFTDIRCSFSFDRMLNEEITGDFQFRFGVIETHRQNQQIPLETLDLSRRMVEEKLVQLRQEAREEEKERLSTIRRYEKMRLSGLTPEELADIEKLLGAYYGEKTVTDFEGGKTLRANTLSILPSEGAYELLLWVEPGVGALIAGDIMRVDRKDNRYLLHLYSTEQYSFSDLEVEPDQSDAQTLRLYAGNSAETIDVFRLHSKPERVDATQLLPAPEKLEARESGVGILWEVPREGGSYTNLAMGLDGTLVAVFDREGLTAFTAGGQKKWYFHIGKNTETTPAISADGTVYVGSDDGNLYAIAPDGLQKWMYETNGGSIRSSVAVGKDGTVYVAPGSGGSTICAVTPAGDIAWKYENNESSAASDLAVDNEGTVYFTDYKGNLCAVSEGYLKWSIRIRRPFQSYAPLIGPDGTVYNDGMVDVENGDAPSDGSGGQKRTSYRLLAVEPEGREKWAFELEDSLRYRPAVAADGTVYVGVRTNLFALTVDGQKKWTCDLAGSIASGPVIGPDGTIYLVLDKNRFCAVAGTGETLWVLGRESISGATHGVAENSVVYIASYYSLQAIVPAARQVWASETESFVESGPAIGPDGTIVFGSNDGNVYAVAPDGSQKWAVKTGGMINASAAVASDGTIYIGSMDGKLYALSADGAIIWSFRTRGRVLSTPTLGSDGTIYVGSSDGALYALDTGGNTQWIYTADGSMESGPVVGIDGTIYAGSARGGFHAVKPNGQNHWIFTTDSPVRSHPALGADGTIYFGDEDGKVYAVDQTGSLKWIFTTGYAVYASPVVGSDGTVFVGSGDWNLYAISPDGEKKWAFEADGGIYSSPALGADGSIFFGCEDGKVYAVSDNGKKKWSYETGGGLSSSPVIGSDGRLYIGSRTGKLYAMETGCGGLADGPWPMYANNPSHTRF